jgi:death-on-curing protein
VTEKPEFLTLDEILEIHDDQIQHYGGDVGIRDRRLLESAVAMPQQSFGGQIRSDDRGRDAPTGQSRACSAAP